MRNVELSFQTGRLRQRPRMDELTVPTSWEERASSVSSQESLAPSTADSTLLASLPTLATPMVEVLESSGDEGSSFTVVGTRRRRGSSSAASEEGRGRGGVTEVVLGRTDAAYLLGSRAIREVRPGFLANLKAPMYTGRDLSEHPSVARVTHPFAPSVRDHPATFA